MRETCVRIDGRVVLGPVDLVVRRGEHWVLIGPNGGGKTTLLSLAGARRQPTAGRVWVLGKRLGSADIRAIHPRISHTSHVLTETMPTDISVETVVLTGKRATLSPWFQAFDPSDRRRARDLLEQVGCADLVDRPSQPAARANGSACCSPARCSRGPFSRIRSS
jgi:iron complex transport system ATP-binding protein